MADDMDLDMNEMDPMDGAQKLDFAKIIGEKLQESIRKLDVLSLVQKMAEQVPQDEEAETAQNKLKEVIEQYNSMSDEDREDFSAKMKEALVSKIAMKMKDPSAFDLSGLETAIQDAVRYQIMLVAGGVILFVILLVFFGYKLYKSIKEKEVKREEKKKAKQMKKKK